MGDYYVNKTVKEVAKHTNLRQDIVAEVLSGYQDVAIEKLTNDDSFNILGLVTITAKEWKKSGINGNVEKGIHERLTAKISWRVRELRKLVKSNTGEYLTRKNWREWHQVILNKKSKNKKKTEKSSFKKQVTVGFDLFDDE